jgi:hypothetical protein
MKRIYAIVAVLAFALVAACAGFAPAQTFTEKLAYADAGATGSIKVLMGLTCRKYTTAGICTEAGRPLHPARSDGYLDSLSKVRKAVRAAATMPATGGMCLDQPSTPTACLALASVMLTEVQKILEDLQK